MNDTTISNDTIVIERTFDAPIDVIWQLWTQPEHFQNWYGPRGFTVPVAEMDVQVGGRRFVAMESPDGSMKFWTVGEFTEIVPNERLVYTENLSDADGTIITETSEHGIPPMSTVVTVVLEAVDGGTKMTMTHAGLPDAAVEGSGGGWNQAFDKIEAYIKNGLNKQ